MSIIRLIVRVLFAAFFIGAGVTHFTNEAFFTAIVPPHCRGQWRWSMSRRRGDRPERCC
jgi:uncharacterized membrane protein